MHPKTNPDEFLALVNQHKGMLHKVCNLYCATDYDKQDLFQEIVIQLWRAYPRFRGDSKFSTWLYRIALNTAISDLRKQKNLIKSVEPDLLPTEIQDIQYNKDKEEKLAQLYKAIHQLPEIERGIVMLYLDDKSYEEMEEILGINQNNLRVKMNRIKEKLRKLTKAVEHGVG
ncbi:RNA polymerase sigma-70 factor (ECF subfamily) [Pseudobacter ginsenosidimutans]|uniref:RNA polymerase sigma-70 factor (ECF subfamily) n=1 Tax=Pseudobacter ginsenosidimutans TaxID=661488 RepID=A0A4Q7MTD8_9BACT|nr:RNA polymerase sigma factor [Pseudobacter ginsenosidimutans]RZS71877.1 RNA polymerase sigma-70 factor (ECF subfamily) [Pseudobacter ginsenosidimutans]